MTAIEINMDTEWGIISANLEEHMQEFQKWMKSEHKSDATVKQYFNLVRAMMKQADIRAESIFQVMLLEYQPGSHSLRKTARNCYIEFLGGNKVQTTGKIVVRKGGTATIRELKRVIHSYLELLLDGVITVPLDGFVAQVEKEYMENYEKFKEKRSEAIGKFINEELIVLPPKEEELNSLLEELASIGAPTEGEDVDLEAPIDTDLEDDPGEDAPYDGPPLPPPSVGTRNLIEKKEVTKEDIEKAEQELQEFLNSLG